MSARNVLALAIAIIVGYVAIKIIFAVLNVVIGLFGFLIYGAIAALVIYVLYRFFSQMVNSGRRFT